MRLRGHVSIRKVYIALQDYVDENADSDVIDIYKGVALWRTIFT